MATLLTKKRHAEFQNYHCRRLNNGSQRYPGHNSWNLWRLPYVVKRLPSMFKLRGLRWGGLPYIIQVNLKCNHKCPHKGKTQGNKIIEVDVTTKTRDQNDVAMSQRFPRNAYNLYRLELAWNRFSPGASRRNQPCCHLDFILHL